MNSPCKNCLLLPVCNYKSPYMRIERCSSLKEYIAYKVVKRTETGQIVLPRYVVALETAFETTHFPMHTDPGEEYLTGIGMQGTDRSYNQPSPSHMVLTTVSGHKKIIDNNHNPLTIIKL